MNPWILLLILGIPSFGLEILFFSLRGKVILMYRRERRRFMYLLISLGSACVLPSTLLLHSGFGLCESMGVLVLALLSLSGLTKALVKVRRPPPPELPREEELEEALRRTLKR